MITTFVAAVTVLGAERGIQLFKFITEPVQTGGQGRGAAGVVVARPGLALSPETGLTSERVTGGLTLLLQVIARAPPLTLLLLARVIQEERDGLLPALQTQLGEVAEFPLVRQVENTLAHIQTLILDSGEGGSSSLTVDRTERTRAGLQEGAEGGPVWGHQHLARHCSRTNINLNLFFSTLFFNLQCFFVFKNFVLNHPLIRNYLLLEGGGKVSTWSIKTIESLLMFGFLVFQQRLYCQCL